MAKALLLYENFADAAVLAGGSWLASLPLSNLQDSQVTKVARSTGLDPSETTFTINLTGAKAFKAMAFGPSNISSGGKFRIRGYSDAARTDLVVDTGEIGVGQEPVDSLDLEWEDENFWYGVQPIDDPDNSGIWMVHVFPAQVTAQFWTFDVNDQGNPDGYVQIGRAYMGRTYEPSFNFSPSGNSFGFVSNTTSQKSLAGQMYFNRYKAARRFRFAFPYLDEAEVWDEVYRIQLIAGVSEQVFLIIDPDDTANLNKSAFLGRLSELSSWELLNINLAGTAFDIVESL